MRRVLFWTGAAALAWGVGSGCQREEDGRTVLRLLDAPDRSQTLDSLARVFEAAHPEVNVERVEGPSDPSLRENLYSSAFWGGVPYDVILMESAWLPEFASKGWLLSLDSLVTSEDSLFFPGELGGSRFLGTLYRFPLESDANVLYYRKDWLDSLGLSPPTTFADLESAARRLQSARNVDGFVFSGRQGEELTTLFLEALWGCGGRWAFPDESGTWSLGIPSPEGDLALEFLRKATRGSQAFAPTAVMGYGPEEAVAHFREGRAAFLHAGVHASTLLQREGSPLQGKFGILPVPSLPGLPSISAATGIGAGIARESAHPELAWAFIRFLFEPASQKALLRGAGRYPARADVYADAELRQAFPELSSILPVFRSARAKPMHPKYSLLSDSMQRSVASVLIGAAAPQDALQTVAEIIIPHLR